MVAVLPFFTMCLLLMVKTRLTFRLDSQAKKSLMPFFTYGRSQGLSIHRARGLLALNQTLIQLTRETFKERIKLKVKAI
jgi:hypothetical protein